MSEIETLSEMKARWRFLLTAYAKMAKMDHGDDSPVKNQVALAMGNQLSRCIDDLEKVMNGDPRRRELAKILKENVGG